MRYKILSDGTSIMVRSLDDLIALWKTSKDKTAIEDAVKLRDHLIKKAHEYDKRHTQWLDEQPALFQEDGAQAKTHASTPSESVPDSGELTDPPFSPPE